MKHRRITFPVLLCLFLLYGQVSAQEFVTAPYLQSPTPTSMWIAWETAGAGQARVEWGPTEELGETASGHSHAGPGDHRHHKVQLIELMPATRYYYRVSFAGLRSEIHYFTTPPEVDSEAPTRFVAMSDMQRDGGNPDKYRQIIEEGVIPVITAEHGNDLSRALSMALIPGDLVHNGDVYSEWADTFFAPGAALMAHVPFYPVPGNHERDSEYFFDYFHLPENGTAGFEEHWWYIDHSNVRVIGLDSNGGYRTPIQLEWLDEVLTDACATNHVDFVFAQLHHPHHSELWPAGNTAYTGDVISRLEAFSTDCGKPSLHFFGHTHGYARGQSRDHAHTMVNVATAGGNVDYWDEYAQIDYPEYMVSHDEYGFVLVEVEAGEAPHFVLRRISQGNVITPRDNEERDRLEIRLNNLPPAAPVSVGPHRGEVNSDCFSLAVTPFDDVDGDHHQATQWQIATDCGFEEPLVDLWNQSQNWYRNEDRRAGLSLIAQEFRDLEPATQYCWRARFRDGGMVWSEWSEPERFTTGAAEAIDLPLVNPGAEAGTEGWLVERGILESVGDGECDAAQPRTGERFFVVGGVCESTDLSIVSQRVDLAPHRERIETNSLLLRFGGTSEIGMGRMNQACGYASLARMMWCSQKQIPRARPRANGPGLST